MSQQASYKAEIHELYAEMLNTRERSEMQAALSAKMRQLVAVQGDSMLSINGPLARLEQGTSSAVLRRCTPCSHPSSTLRVAK